MMMMMMILIHIKTHISIYSYKHMYVNTYIYIHIYMYMYIHIYFFIIQHVKARAIHCPHQPPTRGDNTFSVAQGGTTTPGATKQLLPPDWVFKRIIYIYIYIRQINYEQRLHWTFIFIFSVQFVI